MPTRISTSNKLPNIPYLFWWETDACKRKWKEFFWKREYSKSGTGMGNFLVTMQWIDQKWRVWELKYKAPYPPMKMCSKGRDDVILLKVLGKNTRDICAWRNRWAVRRVLILGQKVTSQNRVIQDDFSAWCYPLFLLRWHISHQNWWSIVCRMDRWTPRTFAVWLPLRKMKEPDKNWLSEDAAEIWTMGRRGAR